MKLKLDDLRIESFETAGVQERRGTVHGHSGGYQTCDIGCEDTFNPQYTCYDTGCAVEDTVGLSCACVSMNCTGDPNEAYCYDSYNYCVETQRPQHTCWQCW